jgi:hypothetical protein
MSRNRYTKLVRNEQRAQLARQEKELAAIRRSLRRPVVDVVVTPAAETKRRRRARLERRRLDKPTRYAVAAASSPAAPANTEIAA